jgi:hypothetical protein
MARAIHELGQISLELLALWYGAGIASVFGNASAPIQELRQPALPSPPCFK